MPALNGWFEMGNGEMRLLENGYVIKTKAKPMITTGTYINLWSLADGTYDVFIMLNEANDKPTPDEVDAIGEAIRPVFEDDSIKNAKKKKAAQKILDNLELNCLEFGGQIVVNQFGNWK